MFDLSTFLNFLEIVVTKMLDILWFSLAVFKGSMSTLFPSCLIKFFAGQFDCYPILQLLLLLLDHLLLLLLSLILKRNTAG